MKKLVLISILAMVAVSMIACSTATTASPTAQAKPTLASVKATSKIIAEGKVIPAQSAFLGMQIGGLVSQVPVATGAQVKAGQLLVQLDSKQLEL